VVGDETMAGGAPDICKQNLSAKEVFYWLIKSETPTNEEKVKNGDCFYIRVILRNTCARNHSYRDDKPA
jgi:hypothetical protein